MKSWTRNRFGLNNSWNSFRKQSLVEIIKDVNLQSGLRNYSNSSAAEQVQQNKTQQEKLGISAIILLLPSALTFLLGTWQIQRRQQKIELLQFRAKRLEELPVPIAVALKETSNSSNVSSSTEKKQWESDSLECRRILCEGYFQEDKTIFVGPRAKSVYGVNEKGYYVITPLVPSNPGKQQPSVLVNRGWVPSSWREEHHQKVTVSKVDTSDKDVQTGAVTVTKPQSSWWFWGNEKKAVLKPVVEQSKVSGVIRSSEIPSSFVPSNVPEAGQWFYIDIPSIAKSCGLPEDSILVDLISWEKRPEDSNDFAHMKYPAPKDPAELLKQRVMPDDHLTYSATWFTLSAATGILAYKRLTMKRFSPVRVI